MCIIIMVYNGMLSIMLNMFSFVQFTMYFHRHLYNFDLHKTQDKYHLWDNEYVLYFSGFNFLNNKKLKRLNSDDL